VILLKFKRKNTVGNSYLEFGFAWCGDESERKSQCVLCYEVVLSNECMKHAKLRRHLESKHYDLNNKPIDFFFSEAREIKSWTKYSFGHGFD
jgi:hypothetical protein